eukprot:1696876-Prymnesium_polylepis.1
MNTAGSTGPRRATRRKPCATRGSMPIDEHSTRGAEFSQVHAPDCTDLVGIIDHADVLPLGLRGQIVLRPLILRGAAEAVLRNSDERPSQ